MSGASPNVSRWDRFEASLSALSAGQAATDARLSELFRAHSATQADAKGARDGVTRIAAILEEQKIGVRLAEAQAAFRTEQQALRQDFMLAMTNLRKDVEAELDDLRARIAPFEDARAHALRAEVAVELELLKGRIAPFEAARAETRGVARLFGWVASTSKWAAVMGGGVLVGKLIDWIKGH
jgi:hypothetical protein